MCGIVGYLGNREVIPVLLDGLSRLEYRGYDSAGITVVNGRSLYTVKKVGTVEMLAEATAMLPRQSSAGLAHTRWATHGEPAVQNAHPHVDCTGSIAIVHNGIIENYAELRKSLEPYHRFESQTDTEAVVHLIEEHLKTEGTIEAAVMRSLKAVRGSYGLAIVFGYEPRMIIAARNGSPMVIGIGDNEYFIASDLSAFRQYTDRALFLSDGEIALITADGVTVRDLDNSPVERDEFLVAGRDDDLGSSGRTRYMEKEIFEQPQSLSNAMRGRLNERDGTAHLGGIKEFLPVIADARRIILVGSGSSWHAALIAEYMLEQYAQIPVDVENASEFRYRNPVISAQDVVIAISRSGESDDTIAAVRDAKKKGALVLGISNVVGSSVARLCDAGIYTYAGREIGIASTKTYTSQLMVLSLLTLAVARYKRLLASEGSVIINGMKSLPGCVERILAMDDQIRSIASHICDAHHVLFFGRGYHFPNALEGALKLKEVSYIHAEGYPAAEMKHGPIALIDKKMPVVFIAPRDLTYGKIMNNIHEVRARKGKVITIAEQGDEQLWKVSDHIIGIPAAPDLLFPILSVIPLQMLAYHIAVLRGCEVDMPGNLEKSMTVG